MKKILAHLTGIVFLITILVAGGCSRSKDNDFRRVIIYLQAHETKEGKHLKMYDSNDTTIVVVDTLHTEVRPGTKVIWKLVKDRGIEKAEKIGPKNPGKIIIEDATRILFTKKFKLKIPRNAPCNTEEKYDIDFLDKDSIHRSIDPYVRIPD